MPVTAKFRSVTCVFLVCAIPAIAVAGHPSTRIAAAAKNVREIIAHRGASAERPECTLSAIRRAIEVGATAIEVDVRTSKDGHLVILHDNTLDRTTNGKGPVGGKTLKQLRQLDAGSWFDPKYRTERVPTLQEVLQVLKAARTKTALLLDLKEQGSDYDSKVVRVIRTFGDPARIIVGVRSVAQAKRFRKLLPKSRQLGLIPKPKQIEAFAAAGVETIRLWPKWLSDRTLIPRVRKSGAKLHLNGTTGKEAEVVRLLNYRPESLSSDDPARLRKTIRALMQK